MSTMGRRVALLARPGVACDRLRGALVDAGVDLVLEADPLVLDPATLDAARAQVVLVALDMQTEEALDRFEAVLHDPAIEVIFEEAELAARREGWEAARWVRHLAAKLHRHGDVLPPGGESGPGESTLDADNDWSVAIEQGGVPGLDLDLEGGVESVSVADPGPGPAMPAYAFDPLLAEIEFEDDRGAMAAVANADGVAPVFDSSLEYSYTGDFDTVTLDSIDSMDTSSANGASTDQGAYISSDDLVLDDLGGGAQGLRAPEFDQMSDGGFTVASASDQGTSGLASIDVGDAGAGSVKGSSKRVLELVSTDPGMVPDPRDYDAGGERVADHRFKHDLASLESRIASMELVDDRIVAGPAQAGGAVLVMAGIGGPDAVRQLLGALPASFPRPVLVQQRLDGGRYDKLVAQMQRATALPVKLAGAGLPAEAGAIYILPAGVGINIDAGGMQFIDGNDNVLAALPSADSAVLLLSGSDPAQIDAVMNHSWAGALVIGQSPDGCYDPVAPSALIARGGGSGQPAELAERLSERWRT